MAAFVSFAQNGEDVILWRALGHVRNGRYIDVGAHEPDHLTVTKAFCDRGWRGIDIEPEARCAQLLRDARPNNEVVQAAITDEPVSEIELQRDVVVPARTLDAVCSSSSLLTGDLHFLKVDAEGAEAAVLRSTSLGQWRPWVVVVEAVRPLSSVPSREEWESVLTSAGYEFVLFDGLNRYYLSPDHPELRESLSYPACVLDDFVTATAQSAAEDLNATRTELVHWRNLAISGFAESTKLAQREARRSRRLERKVKRLEQSLATARARFANLNSHFEVRVRRKLGRMTRGLRGRS